MRPYIARSRYIRMPHIVPDKDAVQAVITGSHDHSPCPIGDDFSDANALVLQPLRKLVLISMRRDENLSSALSRLCCRTVSGIGCVTGGVPTGDLLGGGGGWMPGTYDAETNTVWWGTANPSPLYDWSGSDWQKSGPRPGTNLYTTSVIALDPDTGKLKFYHQELPHDAWDFDSAVGEFLMIDRDGQKLVVHPNKGGFIFVYDRANAKVQNVWRIANNINFVKDIDAKTGELIGRRDLSLGAASSPLCPAIAGGVSWNSGSYSPKTGLWYKIAQEWCMDVDVVKTTPITEPMAQLNIGANFKLVPPPDGPARGHLDARDQVTGAKKWEVNFDEPPLASVLATAGNLVFVPDSRGVLRAYNAETGQELWSHFNGVGHNGGIITYSAGGKQYIAVPAGWGGMVADEFPALFGEPFTSMPKDAGALVVFTLKQQ